MPVTDGMDTVSVPLGCPIPMIPVHSMRLLPIILLALLLCLPSACPAISSSQEQRQGVSLEELLERALEHNLVSGAVVVVGNRDGILHTASRGNLTPAALLPPGVTESIFDLASLTKVVATAPAIMALAGQGAIDLQAPLSRWFPEFRGSVREELTPFHLLTHTSGLSDVSLTGDKPLADAIRKAAIQKPFCRPGSRFRYADINFILLGELVHRASGRSLAEYCRTEIYEPLGLRRTMFLPPSNLAGQIAPTSGTPSGMVQDRNAQRLGGVAGHAGLFSSAGDLARYARMILGGGQIDGKRILPEETIAYMTSGHALPGGIIRTPGWDVSSPYSAPRGLLFSGRSFGHTGYSGSSIWIDPVKNLFVVLLTNRIDYTRVDLINQLRRNVSTVAAIRFGTGMVSPLPEPDDLLRELTLDVNPPSPHLESRKRVPGVRGPSHGRVHAGARGIRNLRKTAAVSPGRPGARRSS